MKKIIFIVFLIFSIGVNAQMHRLNSQSSDRNNSIQNYRHSQDQQNTRNYRSKVEYKSNHSDNMDFRKNYNYYNTGRTSDKHKKDFRTSRSEAIKKQYFEEANRKNNWRRKARRKKLIFDECIAQIYLENVSRSNVEKEHISIYLKEEEVYVVPANQTWHILNKNIDKGENVSIFSNSGKDIILKAYPKSDNSLLLVNGENPTDQKILIQKYLMLESGTTITVSNDTEAFVYLK